MHIFVVFLTINRKLNLNFVPIKYKGLIKKQATQDPSTLPTEDNFVPIKYKGLIKKQATQDPSTLPTEDKVVTRTQWEPEVTPDTFQHEPLCTSPF